MKEVDLCGLQCPGPLIELKKELDALTLGEIIKVSVSDPGFCNDIEGWTACTGNSLLQVQTTKGITEAVIQKGCDGGDQPTVCNTQNGQTIVVFSNDLDKAIAAFIIANGAASMGQKVSLFFTFWGLSVVKKTATTPQKKTLLEKMFSLMLPKDSHHLPLSKMNMGGMGAKMIRFTMKKKNVLTLEALMQQAIDSGVELIACTMSMDIMGVKEEELVKGVQLGGVGYYLSKADQANKNLFI